MHENEKSFLNQRHACVCEANCKPSFQKFFFLSSILIVRGEAASTRREAPREKNNRSVSGALSNRKHGLFHIRYFENGPLEPGYLTGGLRYPTVESPGP